MPVSSPISGLPVPIHIPVTEPQTSTTIEHILNYLIAINSHSMVQSTPEVPKPVPTPSSPSSTTSEQPSTCPSPLSPISNPDEEDTQSTSSKDSITSMSRQLRPHVPISYNETILKHLHGKPQVKTLNNISIPLPMDSSSKDTDNTDTEYTDEENEMHFFQINA